MPALSGHYFLSEDSEELPLLPLSELEEDSVVALGCGILGVSSAAFLLTPLSPILMTVIPLWEIESDFCLLILSGCYR